MSIKKTYSEKLKDPRWQKKRLEVLNRDNFTCQRCFDSEETLNVHHLRYRSGNDPWEYENDCLLTLCESCHKFEHEHKDEYGKLLVDALYKKGFLSSELQALACDVEQCNELPHAPEVTNTVLGWLFNQPNVFKGLVDSYFEYLQWKREKREADNVLQN